MLAIVSDYIDISFLLKGRNRHTTWTLAELVAALELNSNDLVAERAKLPLFLDEVSTKEVRLDEYLMGDFTEGFLDSRKLLDGLLNDICTFYISDLFKL